MKLVIDPSLALLLPDGASLAPNSFSALDDNVAFVTGDAVYTGTISQLRSSTPLVKIAFPRDAEVSNREFVLGVQLLTIVGETRLVLLTSRGFRVYPTCSSVSLFSYSFSKPDLDRASAAGTLPGATAAAMATGNGHNYLCIATHSVIYAFLASSSDFFSLEAVSVPAKPTSIRRFVSLPSFPLVSGDDSGALISWSLGAPSLDPTPLSTTESTPVTGLQAAVAHDAEVVIAQHASGQVYVYTVAPSSTDTTSSAANTSHSHTLRRDAQVSAHAQPPTALCILTGALPHLLFASVGTCGTVVLAHAECADGQSVIRNVSATEVADAVFSGAAVCGDGRSIALTTYNAPLLLRAGLSV
jgi:hypothetical protein